MELLVPLLSTCICIGLFDLGALLIDGWKGGIDFTRMNDGSDCGEDQGGEWRG